MIVKQVFFKTKTSTNFLKTTTQSHQNSPIPLNSKMTKRTKCDLSKAIELKFTSVMKACARGKRRFSAFCNVFWPLRVKFTFQRLLVVRGVLSVFWSFESAKRILLINGGEVWERRDFQGKFQRNFKEIYGKLKKLKERV